jgi:carbamoyl-phosphate synthase large subunit
MSRFGILVSSAGRRVALLELLRRDAEALGLAPRLIATDLRPPLSAACAVADLALAVPPAAHPEFAEALVAICRAHEVRLLVPTIDPELAPIAAVAARLRAAGTHVNISSPGAVAVARDKLLTARALGPDAPRTALPAEVLQAPEGWSFPLLAKPRAGSASSGIRRVATIDEVRALPDGHVVQQLLAGREFTVNLFVSDGRTLAAVPHLRREVRAGEVAKAITLRHPALAAIAERLPGAVPGLAGALCFQAIEDGEAPKLIEINARFGGGFPIAHQAGAPFTRWLVAQAAGLPVAAADDWREGVTMLRYDAAAFGTADPATWR